MLYFIYGDSLVRYLFYIVFFLNCCVCDMPISVCVHMFACVWVNGGTHRCGIPRLMFFILFTKAESLSQMRSLSVWLVL